MANRDLKLFKKDVVSVCKSEGNVRDRYQALGVEGMEHYHEHGDSERMAFLINRMSTSSPYRKLMLKWVKKWAPVRTEKNPDAGENGVKFKTASGKRHQETDLNGAREEMFYLTAGKPGEIEFDELSVLARMLKQHDRIADGEGTDKYSVIKRLPDEAVKLLRRAEVIAKKARLEDEATEIVEEDAPGAAG